MDASYFYKSENSFSYETRKEGGFSRRSQPQTCPRNQLTRNKPTPSASQANGHNIICGVSKTAFLVDQGLQPGSGPASAEWPYDGTKGHASQRAPESATQKGAIFAIAWFSWLVQAIKDMMATAICSASAGCRSSNGSTQRERRAHWVPLIAARRPTRQIYSAHALDHCALSTELPATERNLGA